MRGSAKTQERSRRPGASGRGRTQGNSRAGREQRYRRKRSSRTLFFAVCVTLVFLVAAVVIGILFFHRGKEGDFGHQGEEQIQQKLQELKNDEESQEQSAINAGDGQDIAQEDDSQQDGLGGGSGENEDEVQVFADEGLSLASLDSPYAILLDGSSGEVLASKRGEEKIFPASMVKMMTVLVAIENISDLDRTITMSYDYFDALYEQDASRAGFEPGEEAQIRDLLYGAMLPSGAECCMELARLAAGSETDFVDLMNEKAAELRLTQTHFTNCTGLHNDDEYSTPHEIATVLRAGLQNETFRDVITTHRYSVPPTSEHPDGFTFWSTMFKAMESETVTGGEIMGGKTGFTDEAGRCLASMAEIDGNEYILVTAGWAADPRTEMYNINDAFLGYNILGNAITQG